MTVRSMTGFARLQESIAGLDAVLSLKSVNHRGLDIHFYMSSELDPYENAMRTIVKKHVGRGHIEIRVQLQRSAAAGGASFDCAKLDAYVAAFRAAAARYQIDTDPDLNSALQIPGVLAENAVSQLPDNFEVAITALLERALLVLNEFRMREGIELARGMLERNASISAAANRMEQLRETVLPALRVRLRERLSDLLSSASIDPQRLAQEAAMLADRGDIGEEISRLQIHASQVKGLLTNGSEVGKKLDFLLQEMNRETNTILSKTAGIGECGLGITDLALASKSDIEKIREQSLNLE